MNDKNICEQQFTQEDIAICKELKEHPELGIIAGYWASIATHWHREAEKNAAKVVELEKKLEETTAMLKFAISDLRLINNCGMCKHFNKASSNVCLAEACKENDCWEWRGKGGRE